MTPASDVIEALKAIDPPAFALVEGAAEFAAIDGVPVVMPAAYVLAERETSEPSERMTGPVLQLTLTDVAVIIVTGNLSDPVGGAAAADLEGLKRTVRGAVIGLVPSASQDGSPFQHVEAELLRARGGVVWQRELFSASFFQEQKP